MTLGPQFSVTFVVRDLKHLVREVGPDDLCSFGALVPREREITGSRANIQYRGVTGRWNHPHGSPSPVDVGSTGEKVVQKVIPARDLAKHLTDSIPGLVYVHGCLSSCDRVSNRVASGKLTCLRPARC